MEADKDRLYYLVLFRTNNSLKCWTFPSSTLKAQYLDFGKTCIMGEKFLIF